jgi:hypothetical protein
VKDFGFRERPEELPKPLQIAMANRLAKWQVERLASQRHRPFFFVGTWIFPAGAWALTFGIGWMSLQDIANSMTLATLRGYNRHAVKSQNRPALYPGSSVHSAAKGMILFGLHEYHQTIHELQGGMYDRKKEIVEIELADSSSMQVEVDVYVWNGEVSELFPLTEKDWSPMDFLNSPFYEPMAIACANAEECLKIQTHVDLDPKSMKDVLHR